MHCDSIDAKRRLERVWYTSEQAQPLSRAQHKSSLRRREWRTGKGEASHDGLVVLARQLAVVHARLCSLIWLCCCCCRWVRLLLLRCTALALAALLLACPLLWLLCPWRDIAVCNRCQHGFRLNEVAVAGKHHASQHLQHTHRRLQS